LRDKIIPQVEGEVLVSAAETSNEVVLEGVNGTFSSIVTMNTRRDKLKIDPFLGHEVLGDDRGLIVESLQLVAKTCCSKTSVDGLVSM
jgi:hypothetical protein